MMIIPDSLFKHPENKVEILDALEEFFDRDVYIDNEEEIAKEHIREILQDEPEIWNIIRDEVE